MRVLVTGANGFIARNLLAALARRSDIVCDELSRATPRAELTERVASADFIFHLAGVNRPSDPSEFAAGNGDLTLALCDAVRASGRPISVLLSSSTQAGNGTPYGQSKLLAEEHVANLHRDTQSPVFVYRLPNVFGKWSRPNYNSAVATFCHNVARGLPVTVHDPAAPLRLVYVDDVVDGFLRALDGGVDTQRPVIEPEYHTTVGELAAQITSFLDCRSTLVSERVGTGLTRALYATYVANLAPEQFAYKLPQYGDARGTFVEMLKTKDSGQFSFFTAHPGITRGGHYHHTKTEKFLVLRGRARFGFRHIVTGETYEVLTHGAEPVVVETTPGWAHDITNVGDEEMVVMLWANEIFDRDRPDTFSHEV